GADSLREAPHQGFLALSRAEVPRLLRNLIGKERRQFPARPQAQLCGLEPVPDCRGTALRIPQAHEAVREEDSARDRAARSRSEAPAPRRLSGVETARAIQPMGHLSLLQTA